MQDKKQSGGSGSWSEQDQMKAAERGQGAEIGATHGPDWKRGGQGKAGEAAYAGNKPGASRKKKK